jgi:predicted SprT family Zn-dependent metalloprotease
LIVLIALILLAYNWYINYAFKNNPLSQEIMNKVNQKTQHLEALAFKHYKVQTKIPVIISDKMPNRLYGAATYSKQFKSAIYLNKKRFQENVNYMIDSVLPHEYAHAIMFQLGYITKKNGGHTLKWQQICLQLGGNKCNRFVNNNDVILEKTNPF